MAKDNILSLVPKIEEANNIPSIQEVLDDDNFQTANEILILSWDEDDNFYANSNMRKIEAVHLLEVAKKYILEH